MPDLKTDITALNWAVDNIDSEHFPTARKARLVGQELGLAPSAMKELKQANDVLKQDPSNQEAISLRNRAFDVIATVRPSEEVPTQQGAAKMDRIVIKNILSSEPSMQQEYLARKGFQTRMTPQGIEYKKEGELRFQPLDPKGLDWMDVSDVMIDAIQGGIEGFATAGKVTTAPTLAGPVLIGGISGATASGIEAFKQGVQKALGLRQGMDTGKIASEGLTSGIMQMGLSGIGKALGWAGKEAGIAGARDAALKPNVAEIDAAAKEIGAIATPGRRSASLEVQKAEDALVRSPGYLGLNKVKKQAEQNLAAEDKTAKEIAAIAGVTPDSARTNQFQAGQAAKEKIGAKIKKKIDDASTIFNDIETKLDRGALKVDLSSFTSTIDKLKDDYGFDQKTMGWLTSIEEQAKGVVSVGDLKKFKTAIGNELARNKQDPAMRRSAAALLGELESAKGQAFNNAIDKELTKLGWKPGMTPDQMTDKQFQKGADKIAYFTGLKKDLEDASKLWREANEELAGVLKRPGEDIKGGANYNLQKLMKSQPEKVLKKVLATGDTQKIVWLADKFPEAVDAAYLAKISQVQEKIQKQVYGKYGETSTANSIFATRFINAMNNLPEADRALILGVDAKKKFEALKTFVNSKNPLANNSGTAYTMALQSAWKEPVSGLVQVIKQWNRLRGEQRGALSRGAGVLLDSPYTRGAAGGLLPSSQGSGGQANMDLTGYLLPTNR